MKKVILIFLLFMPLKDVQSHYSIHEFFDKFGSKKIRKTVNEQFQERLNEIYTYMLEAADQQNRQVVAEFIDQIKSRVESEFRFDRNILFQMKYHPLDRGEEVGRMAYGKDGTDIYHLMFSLENIHGYSCKEIRKSNPSNYEFYCSDIKFYFYLKDKKKITKIESKYDFFR